MEEKLNVGRLKVATVFQIGPLADTGEYMRHKPQLRVGVLFSCILLFVSCTSRKEVIMPDVPEVGTLTLSISTDFVTGGDEIIATVSSTGFTSAPNITFHVNLGGQVIVPMSAAQVSQTTYKIRAPLGIVSPTSFQMSSGEASIYAMAESGQVGGPVVSNTVALSISRIFSLAYPGNVSVAYLSATRLLLLESIGNLALLDARLGQSDEARITRITRQLNVQIDLIDEFIAAIRRVQNGETVEFSLMKGVSLNLTPEYLWHLDSNNLTMFRTSPQPISTQRLSESVQSELFDIPRLARELASNAREIAERNRSAVTTGLGIIAAGAALLGAPAVATAAAGLGAIAWLATTWTGAAVGLALDVGTSSILNGGASYNDFKSTQDFVLNAYLEQTSEFVHSRYLEGALGENWGTLLDSAVDVSTDVAEFMMNSVDPAFDSGALPSEGVPASNFSIRMDVDYFSGATYSVTVISSPTISNVTIRVQVSGTDGYRYDQDATMMSGIATFHPAAALPGSGIRDSINGFHIDGRAQTFTTFVF